MNTRIQLFLVSYALIGVLAVGGGVLLPAAAATLAPYTALLLGMIFFLSALSIDVRHILVCLRDVKMVVTVVVCMLFLFAAATFALTQWLAPAFTVAFVLLAAMPVGMTAPLLATISGGRPELALTLAVTTSLLAPFTIPLIIYVFLGAEVSVSFWSMFVDLATIIFIPFVLAQLVSRFLQPVIGPITPAITPLSLLFLGLLITGVIGQQVLALAGFSLAVITPSLLGVLALLLVFHLVGFWLVFWRTVADRVTISVCLTYMNFSLAIYLASEFFADPAVTLTLVVAIIPWVLLLPVFRLLTIRFLHT